MKACKSLVMRERECYETFPNFFSQQDGVCFCNNMAGLFDASGIICNLDEWRLLIDSLSMSLRAVLLHNGNYYPSLPMAYYVHPKED